MTKSEDTLLVGFWAGGSAEKQVLIVGRKPAGAPIQVINAFEGSDAEALHEMLITKVGGKKHDA